MRRDLRRALPSYQLCLCGKTYAATLGIAKNLKREIVARTGHEDQVRYYSCRYGSWHWTTLLDQPEHLKGA